MEKQGDIINNIKKTIQRYRMLSPGYKVIVAVSAGPDSICLLDLLNRLSPEMDLQLVVAHFNHGLRGDEDEFETKLSKDIAQSMGLPCESEKASGLLDNCSSLEERARDARYSFLEKVRLKHGAQKIAMGHNLNDQAETVLMRLLRGSGQAGLAGIPPVRDGQIIRPLIEVNRDEIMQYIEVRALPFATDSSNKNKTHLRNRIRQELMPMMVEYQPRLLEHLGRVSDIIRDEDAFLESMTLEWINAETNKNNEGDIVVAVSSLRHLAGPLKNRVIRDILKSVSGDIYSMEYDHVLSVTGLLDNERPQCSIDLPDGIIVKKTYETLRFISKNTPHPYPLPQGEREFKGCSPQGEREAVVTSPQGEKEIVGEPTQGERESVGATPLRERESMMASLQGERESVWASPQGKMEFVGESSQGKRKFKLSIEGPGTYHLDAAGHVLTLENILVGAGLSIEKNLSIAYLDADKLSYPLVARNFQPGDRFVPMGMRGHKKVKDFFIDLKVPSEKRAVTPVLTSGDDIVWICGYRIDERFKITSRTKRMLKITLIKN
jgi:tRNA(Ile)-lysidine synthetase-like protein